MSGRFGPNTAEVEAMTEKIKTITPEQIDQLRQLDVDSEARAGAWDEALCAYGEYGPDDDAVIFDLHQRVYGVGLGNGFRAVWLAVLAVVTKEWISTEDFDVLYGPWASVMEEEG